MLTQNKAETSGGEEFSSESVVWRRFSRNLTINLSGTILSALLTLVQTALLTKALTLDEYGFVLIVTNLFLFLETFVGVNVGDVLFRFFQEFKSQRRNDELQALLLMCLALCLIVGISISVTVFLSADFIARRVYHNPDLAQLLRVYAGTVLLSSFSGFYDPLLRVHDRFLNLIIPRLLGRILTVTVFAIYFIQGRFLYLSLVVIVLAAGVIVQTGPPLIYALRLVRPFLAIRGWKSLPGALAPHRREVFRTMWHVNVGGYLKLVFSPGDIFLLGLLSSPSQVALYGLAKQLISPFTTLQNNTQAAITPEISSLWAAKEIRRMKDLAFRYVKWATLVSTVFVGASFFFGRPLIAWLARPEYLPALPVFYVMLIIVWLTLISLMAYPLGLSLDLLKWYNLAQLLNIIVLIAFLMARPLEALGMAYVQLIGILILTVAFSLPVGIKLCLLAQHRRPTN
jgi:O-antigen/teichoic acid export membrane protein